MIISLAEAKEWLRIDGTDEDSTITLLIGAAERKLLGGTGVTYDNTNETARLFCLMCITDWYENRLPTNVISNASTSIMTELTFGSGSVAP